MTRKALGRKPEESEEEFEERVRELTGYLGPRQQAGPVDAGPGQDSDVELFLLSSSGRNAKLAAHMGVPLAFAAHSPRRAWRRRLRFIATISGHPLDWISRT
jgi:alkanesulfonate monooxygenase SsuD/methylene tetrahydromethanopterin reductase-like flavin-dependent oxidoreductase (luciferase family)